MGWSDCGDDEYGRPIGYAFQSQCDWPGCPEVIDRGLAYLCGDMHGGEDHKDGYPACGRYFCYHHLHAMQRCMKCIELAEDEDEDDGRHTAR